MFFSCQTQFLLHNYDHSQDIYHKNHQSLNQPHIHNNLNKNIKIDK